MRYVVRVGVVLSVLAVGGAILGVASVDSSLEEAWPGEPEDDSFWPLAGITVLVAAVPLAFIWLGVFVAYVIAKGLRTRG
jgi:uncharacterized BrkB/YihY/UPF0761 family membrane protein